MMMMEVAKLRFCSSMVSPASERTIANCGWYDSDPSNIVPLPAPIFYL